VRERIEYYFRVPSTAVFTLYSYSKALEYRFRVPTAGILRSPGGTALVNAKVRSPVRVSTVRHVEHVKQAAKAVDPGQKVKLVPNHFTHRRA
jgi:hypothetical protein